MVAPRRPGLGLSPVPAPLSKEEEAEFLRLQARPSREDLDELADEPGELIFMDGPEFDAAILGVGSRYGMEDSVVYDQGKVIEILMGPGHGMTRGGAHDWFATNMLGTGHERAWIFVRRP